jgi:5-bromo-4-chloroindolyl phosphate hydrolysis protein
MNTDKPVFSNNQTKILLKKGYEKISDDLFKLEPIPVQPYLRNAKMIRISYNPIISRNVYTLISNKPKTLQNNIFYYFKDLIEEMDNI